jgi:hypothetical protein
MKSSKTFEDKYHNNSIFNQNQSLILDEDSTFLTSLRISPQDLSEPQPPTPRLLSYFNYLNQPSPKRGNLSTFRNKRNSSTLASTMKRPPNTSVTNSVLSSSAVSGLQLALTQKRDLLSKFEKSKALTLEEWDEIG